MPGRLAVVTGSNTGIGKETARELAERGFDVVLACRNTDAAADAAREIASALPAGSGVVTVGPRLDLQSCESVRSFSAALLARHSRLDCLVNNAGCNFIEEWYTDKGVLGLVQINYLGPFLLTRLLETTLARSGGRVVNVSSAMHRFARIRDVKAFLHTTKEEPLHATNSVATTWQPWTINGARFRNHSGATQSESARRLEHPAERAGTYSNTKLANVMLSRELARRSGGAIACASVDPGGVATDIWRATPLSRGIGKRVADLLLAQPNEGCQAVVHAATMPSDCFGADSAPFLARGLVASPALTTWGQNGLLMMLVRNSAGNLCLLFDHAVRALSGGRLGAQTHVVPANSYAADSGVADSLWRTSCELCGLPLEVESPAQTVSA